MPTLDFKGKQFVYAHHLGVPFKQLDIDAKKSAPAKGSKPSLDDNLIIHGDNLHALKALLPKYAGKIKCIYIDPPYNTGNEGWCYNDNVNAPLMKEWLKKEGNPVDKEDMERHDKWLCMMWPRLQLLRELLADDGVIFVSIDDNEVASLQMLMNEIFGERNLISKFVWHNSSRSSDLVAVEHEYILLFAKNISQIKGKWRNIRPEAERLMDIVTKAQNNKKSIEDALVLVKDAVSQLQNEDKQKNTKKYSWLTNYQNLDENWRLYYPVDLSGEGDGPPRKFGDKEIPAPAGRHWMSQDYIDELYEDDRIVWRGERAYRKLYIEETAQTLKGLIQIPTRKGSKQIKGLFQKTIFDKAKPYDLIKELISFIGDKNSIFLDSFAGSGTTAHAVLALNQEDGGNRKFILVQMDEDVAHDKPAYSMGFKKVIEITAERVRRVIKGVPTAKDDTLKKGLGGSFTYCELGQEINIDNLLKGGKLPDYDELARYAFYTATGQTLDKVKKGADYFVGETDQYRVHVIYQADSAFLRSGNSALNAELAQSIAKTRNNKTALVFATHKFMSQKELTELGITYCQLPYAIHRVMGD